MVKTLKPIKLINAFIQAETIEQGHPLYLIEREFQEWVKLHAEFFLQRYRQAQMAHFKQNETANARLGLCGQKAFELLLQLMEVPYVPNDPIIDQRLQKDYDFLIPTLGKIEVKTIHHYCRKLIVKLSEWHSNNLLIVWQMNEPETQLKMIGWLNRTQVEAHTVTRKGETKYNPYSDAYIIDIMELNPADTLIEKLKETKRKFFFSELNMGKVYKCKGF
ncbi:MAG: hypothetical protein NWE95_06990 [Candidatus Bathyarchaeota archaeon]|nr:hypothetical protein [Candidatus Bathyarchaeota archaeon]